MASQVLSGATNASYTNNTGQNVRLIINYMANVTSMSWAGVNVTGDSTTIGKDIQNITGEFRSLELGTKIFDNGSNGGNSRVGPGLKIWETKLGSKKTNIFNYNYLRDTKYGPTYFTGPDPTAPQFGGRSISSVVFPFGENADSKTPNAFLTKDDFESGSAAGDKPLAAGANFFYVPLTVSRGGNFPVELMLAPNQQFSAICGAFNAIVIKEDGT